MDKEKFKKLFYLITLFLVFYFIPIQNERINNSINESLLMLQEYARRHIVLCLIPALLIAGGIAVFVSKESVLKYFGPKANKFLSYSVASVSGAILSVCSCTIIPLFGGIYYRGAGLGPGVAFVYSGPAINILAIVLTARVLGWKMGLARAICAIFIGIVIGVIMHFIYRKEEEKRADSQRDFLVEGEGERSLLKNAIFFLCLIGILVFANWGEPVSAVVKMRDGSVISGIKIHQNDGSTIIKTGDGKEISPSNENVFKIEYEEGIYTAIYIYRFYIAMCFLILLILVLFLWFSKNDLKEWFDSSLDLSLQILPLLFIGVLIAGFALGRPGKEALIPSQWITYLVGGNSLWANLFASISGAFMYFATLTEVPILQGLIGSGMGKGPALSLLLSGPAVSLPSMLVLRKVMGTKKMLVYVGLIVLFSTLFGFVFGELA
jgi:uncharacterized membrane protein YraQ (UPF0718 family)